MKYTKLFNNHSEYVAYTGGTDFIRPNVSYCIQEDEPHCTPSDLCQEGHTYEVVGTPSYPQTVAASATSFDLSFDYNDIYTTVTCHQTITTGSSTAIVAIEENPTTSARTISGVYDFHGIEIQYSLTQEGKDFTNQYLTFDVLSDGTIMWKASDTASTSVKTISYSKDGGENWTEITSTTAGTAINVNAGDKVLIKGTNSRYGYSASSESFSSFNGGTAPFNVEGNIMSLIGGDNFSGLTSFTETWVFRSLFDGSKVVSAENLVLPVMTLRTCCYRAMFANCSLLTTPPELPATTLGDSCYYYMFDECILLTTAPELPATTLANSCYYGMFHHCTSLTTAPVLSATTLARLCYCHMFSGCTSLTTVPSNMIQATTMALSACTDMFNGCTGLTTAPELPATELAGVCYLGMFANCKSLTTAPVLSATTLENYCYKGMFSGCTSLTTAPSLPATTLATDCYCGMFYNCTSLTAAPTLSATTLASNCYDSMFYGCTSLTTAPSLPATTLAGSCYYSMFNRCSKLTTAPVISATTLANKCCEYMFLGCTSLTAAPVLSATTMAASAYTGMFSGCTGLTTALVLPATTMVDNCYRDMFRDCKSLTTIPSNMLPASTLAEGCYRSMFYGCTSLTTTLILSATTLANNCYRGLYYNCKSLTTAPELPATTLAASAYTAMFNGCTSLTTAPVLSAATLENYCYYQMFMNCSKLNRITCLATNISASDCTNNWVKGVAASGTFTKSSAMNDWTTGVNGIPTNWTVEIDGIAAPTIYCDGEIVTLNCDTPSATIYYQLDNVGNFVAYTQPIPITADTVVSAYAELNGDSSTTVSQTCVYNPVVLSAPSITCDGENVTIECVTPNATIYYRLDGGTYSQYSSSIAITADTVVDAYSSYNGRVSSVVTENCEYIPIHHYENDYLTFDVLTGGTIMWKAATTAVTRTISYSINNGEWTEITSTTAGTPITVSSGDKVRLKGNNTTYATAKDAASMFSGGTALYNAEGNVMSLIGGDNFSGLTSFNGQSWVFHDLFNTSNIVSAKNLILPVTTLTNHCYRAMFAHATNLIEAPELPATTLAASGYWYTFQDCVMLEKAPELPATTLVATCYTGMFDNCSSLNYIKCLVTNPSTSRIGSWVNGVAATGTFVKGVGVTGWSTGTSGIPTNWIVVEEGTPDIPTISCNGLEIELSCATIGADIYYRLTNGGSYSAYTTAITMTGDTFIECYSEKDGHSSTTTSMTCEYDDRTIFEYSNQSIDTWTRSGSAVTVPNSVNAIDGHSASYSKGSFNYEVSVNLRDAEPTYLWFQHADHKADIYVDNILVDTHWGGYISFFSDISNYVHKGTNNIKVTLKNNNGNYLAPASGDFNFNATLGKVKLFTSPYMPAMNYGYDGFHITSTVSTGTATINVATNIPTGATVVCTISGVNCNYTATSASTGEEMIFSTTITNPRLWNGKIDPYLYNVKLEIYHDNELYHRYERPYGLRFYEYVINDTVKYGTAQNPYTGFLLNGQPYLLRGCCMHDDIADKANALNDTDYSNTFATIQELGLNFLRLAHYPHPRETYDWCDRLGIVVQTEGPCVNNLKSTMPEDYYTHLTGQYTDMVNQHYNHPCIFFWGLSNETTTDDKAFGKTKIEGYTSLIKNLDSERMVGYVLAQSPGTSPSAYYNDPSNVDWFGCNIYVGWYDSQNSNNPTSQITTRLNNTINRTGVNKPMAYSEYGCGGTQHCHSDDFMNTTTRGNNPRHDIEYMMWLHEGHIAAIKNFPQLMFTSQWQLFDIAVSNRNEGYTVCLDGENTSVNDDLRRLNNKGLVERDHVTKKDTFYLYKAWWNTADTFVHICCKDYTKKTDRVIKCYTNQTSTFTLKVNGTTVETKTPSDNILTFTAHTFSSGDIVTVESGNISDTFTFE